MRRGVTPYLITGAAVLLMTVVRWLLDPILAQQLPFITFIVAALFAAWLGGLGPALFATVAGGALALFLFIPPAYSLHSIGTMGTVGMLLFVLTGLTAGLLGESRLRAQARAEASAIEAQNAANLARSEARRAERTAALQAEEALNQQLEVEAALRSSEARFRAMAESSPLGIYITDPAGDCFYTNPAYQRISGLSEQQAQGTGWSKAIHPEDRERVFREWYQAAERRIPFQSEHRFAHADGKVVWTRVNAAEITDEEQLVGYVGLVEDISQHAAAQTALRQSEERYRAFIEQTAEGVWRFEMEQPVPVTPPRGRANRALLYPRLSGRMQRRPGPDVRLQQGGRADRCAPG